MPWDQNKYLAALRGVRAETDPEVRQALQHEIALYEAQNPLARLTGIEAFEQAAGMQQPSDEEVTADFEAMKLVPDVIPDDAPQYKRPARTKPRDVKSFLVHEAWYEPSLDEFQREMMPVIGDEARAIGEDHPLFQRYADMKWAEAHDAAAKEGKALLRARDIDTSDLAGKAEKVGAEFGRYARPAMLAVEGGITGGFLSSAEAKLAELTGLDPDAMAELEREREQGGSTLRTAGNIAGLLLPGGLAARAGAGAAKLVAPQLGKLVVKGGGSLPARALARGGTAAAAGGAGLATQGGAQDIAQGVNPFSLGFLSRRGEDAAIGAATGPAAELLGAGAARLGRIGEVQRAKDAAREGAAVKRLDPVLAGLGAAAGYSLDTEKDAAMLGALSGLALGSPFGRYALLTHLTRRLPATGEGFFKAAAKELQAAPLAPGVIAAIKEKAIVRGGDVLKPSRGGGSALGIPFTEGAAPGPTTLTPEEAESFIRQIYDEEKAARDAAMNEEDEGFDDETAGEGGSLQEIGLKFPESMPEALSMVDRTLGRNQPKPAEFRQDQQFMAMLENMGRELKKAGADEDLIADTQAGYIRNYDRWRKLIDEQIGAGEANPRVQVRGGGRFDTRGVLRTPRGAELAGEDPDKPGSSADPIAANEQVPLAAQTTEEFRGAEKTGVTTAEMRKDIDKVLKKLEKKRGRPWTAEDIVIQVARHVGVGSGAPPVDVVTDAIKALGYNVPSALVQQVLRGAREMEL